MGRSGANVCDPFRVTMSPEGIMPVSREWRAASCECRGISIRSETWKARNPKIDMQWVYPLLLARGVSRRPTRSPWISLRPFAFICGSTASIIVPATLWVGLQPDSGLARNRGVAVGLATRHSPLAARSGGRAGGRARGYHRAWAVRPRWPAEDKRRRPAVRGHWCPNRRSVAAGPSRLRATLGAGATPGTPA
jgi:hypothetical protein